MVGKIRYLLLGFPLIAGLYIGLLRDSPHSQTNELRYELKYELDNKDNRFVLKGSSDELDNKDNRFAPKGSSDKKIDLPVKASSEELRNEKELIKKWQEWSSYVISLADFAGVKRVINPDGTDVWQYHSMITLGPGRPYGFYSWDRGKKIESIKKNIELLVGEGFWTKAAILAEHAGEELDYDFGSEQLYCEAAKKHREQFIETNSSPHLISAFVAGLKCDVVDEKLREEIERRGLYAATELALAKAGLYEESIEMMKREAEMLEKLIGLY